MLFVAEIIGSTKASVKQIAIRVLIDLATDGAWRSDLGIGSTGGHPRISMKKLLRIAPK